MSGLANPTTPRDARRGRGLADTPAVATRCPVTPLIASHNAGPLITCGRLLPAPTADSRTTQSARFTALRSALFA